MSAVSPKFWLTLVSALVFAGCDKKEEDSSSPAEEETETDLNSGEQPDDAGDDDGGGDAVTDGDDDATDGDDDATDDAGDDTGDDAGTDDAGTDDAGTDDSGETDGSYSGPAELAATLVAPPRPILADDEMNVGGVEFTHYGAVSCSRDGGVTFDDCDSSSTFYAHAADFYTEHQVKVETDESTEYFSFIPSNEWPDVNFVTCTEEVTEDETYAQFNGRINATDKVICLSDGVTVSNSEAIGEGAILIDQDYTTIFVRAGDTATFSNTRTAASQDGIDTEGSHTNFTLIGATIETAAGRGIYVNGQSNGLIGFTNVTTAGTNSQGIFVLATSSALRIMDTEIHTNGSTGIYVTASQIDMIKGAKIFTMGDMNAHGLVVANGATVTEMAYSLIDSQAGRLISLESNATDPWTFVGDHLILHGRAPDSFTKSTFVDFQNAGGTAIINNSIFYMYEGQTGFGGAIYMVGGNAGTLTLEGNTFVRMNAGVSDSWAIRVHGSASNASLLFSYSNENRFCYEPGSSHTFTTPVYDATGEPQPGFDVSAQLDGGSVLECPAEVMDVSWGS